MLRRRIATLAGVTAVIAATLVGFTSGAQASPTPCAAIQGAIDTAADGTVIAVSGPCSVALTVNNPHAFTLQGDGTAVWTRASSGSALLSITGATARFTVSNITFDGTGTAPANGGAINNSVASDIAVTISGNRFINNTVTQFGGAISLQSLDTTMPMVISGNTFGTVGHGNGAVYGGGAVNIGTQQPVQIVGNTFVGNTATGGIGGALAVLNTFVGSTTNPVTISGNVFGGTPAGAGNTASASGGGAFVELAGSQTLSLRNNSFIDNAVHGATTLDRDGGGLALVVEPNQAGYTVTQSANTFTGNFIDATASASTQGAGGGGEWVFGVPVTASNDVFTGNQVKVNDGEAPEGGGLGVEGSNQTTPGPQPGSFVGSNEVFIGNSTASKGKGGGIYTGSAPTNCPAASDCSSHLTLNDSTVSGNTVAAGTSSQGGAIWGSPDDTLAVNNSIIYGNAPQPEIYGFGSSPSAPSFRFTDACPVSGSAAPEPGAGNICADPLLNTNGSETASSPTIDAGSNALVPAGLTSDGFGNPRIAARRCGAAAIVDMGAFEFPAPSCPPATGVTPAATPATLTAGPIVTSSNSVTVSLGCAGTAAQTCDGDGSLFTTEGRRGGKIVSLSRKRLRKRAVTALVGSKHYTLHASQSLKLTVPINATGKALLRRFGRLPVRLVVTVSTATGKVTVATRKTTIKPARKRKRKGR